MRTLPKPLPDELLYSALARATYRYGFWSPKQLLDLIYGRRTVVAVPDLPSNLVALARATAEAWQMSAEELALRHTLVGYYTHFKGSRCRRSALAHMAADGGSFHLRLGICAGAACVPKQLRLCPACHAADIAAYGEAYWHRAHHLPGVLVCHQHGDVLLDTNQPFRPPSRHVYAAAPLDLSLVTLRPVVHRLTRTREALALAARSVQLLDSPAHAPSPRPDYRGALQLRGWGRRRGRLQDLQGVFVGFFGADLLEASFARPDCDPVAWLADVTRAPRRNMHPFKHVLMEVFLRGHEAQVRAAHPGRPKKVKTWGIYRDTELRKDAAKLASVGLTTHAIACALDVDWKTADRLLQPMSEDAESSCRDVAEDRQAWLDIQRSYPTLNKKQLRAKAPALYARLYRHDREWLLAQRVLPSERPVTERRIDWPRRDAEVEALVQAGVAKALRIQPARRASRSYVLGQLGLRALVAHRATLLPRTTAALDELCETVEAFQVRRLAAALTKLPESAPEWALLRAAAIQPRRFDDGARSLIHRAARIAHGRARPAADARGTP